MEATMQAIIPAAGLGTRLAPFSAAVAKELAPIGVKPAIHWTIAEAAAAGVESAVVVISPEKTSLRRYLEGDFPPAYRELEGVRAWMELLETVPLTIALQPEPRGLGDALLRGWRAADEGDIFFLMYPDNIVPDPGDLFARLSAAFLSCGLTTVAGMPDRPYIRGNHWIHCGEPFGPGRRARRFSQRQDPPPGADDTVLRAAGRVLVTNEYFDILERLCSEGVNGDLDDIHAYQVLAERQRIIVVPTGQVIHDAGCPEGYQDAWLAYITGELMA
jgi:UTP-glucose-1-phosphate uridylyltransferase